MCALPRRGPHGVLTGAGMHAGNVLSLEKEPAHPCGHMSRRYNPMSPFSFEIVVVGVGSTIVPDESVGVHAARALMWDPRLESGVAVLDGGMLGLELVGTLADARHVLFLDGLCCDAPPGTAVRMTDTELTGTGNRRVAHQRHIAGLIAGLEMVCEKKPEVVVLALRPSKAPPDGIPCAGFRPAVAPLVEAALKQLNQWHSGWQLPAPNKSIGFVSRHLVRHTFGRKAHQ